MKSLVLLAVSFEAVLGGASAQTVGASLQGTVTDPSGAVVPNASVQITNLGMAAVRTLVTDASGRWRDPVLLPGAYEVRFSAPGFQTTVRKAIQLEVGQDVVVDLRLEVGQNATQIVVEALAPAINLTSGAVSGLVDQKEMRDLPVNGR